MKKISLCTLLMIFQSATTLFAALPPPPESQTYEFQKGRSPKIIGPIELPSRARKLCVQNLEKIGKLLGFHRADVVITGGGKLEKYFLLIETQKLVRIIDTSDGKEVPIDESEPRFSQLEVLKERLEPEKMYSVRIELSWDPGTIARMHTVGFRRKKGRKPKMYEKLQAFELPDDFNSIEIHGNIIPRQKKERGEVHIFGQTYPYVSKLP